MTSFLPHYYLHYYIKYIYFFFIWTDCIAKTKTICYAIKRSDFQRLLGPMHELINVKSKARVLKGVKLLETLNDAEREEIARLMKRCSYATGDTIIKQVS